MTLLPPYQRNGGFLDWYRGTADAVYQNLDFIQRRKADTVLVLSGDHVYKMDYTSLLQYHQERRAPVTICTVDAPFGEASRLDIVASDPDGRVTEFREKPPRSSSTLVSMGIYLR